MKIQGLRAIKNAAKTDAEPDSNSSQEFVNSQAKKASPLFPTGLPSEGVGGIGLENRDETKQKLKSKLKATQKPTPFDRSHSRNCDRLDGFEPSTDCGCTSCESLRGSAIDLLLRACDSLSEDIKKEIYGLLRCKARQNKSKKITKNR